MYELISVWNEISPSAKRYKGEVYWCTNVRRHLFSDVFFFFSCVLENYYLLTFLNNKQQNFLGKSSSTWREKSHDCIERPLIKCVMAVQVGFICIWRLSLILFLIYFMWESSTSICSGFTSSTGHYCLERTALLERCRILVDWFCWSCKLVFRMLLHSIDIGATYLTKWARTVARKR